MYINYRGATSAISEYRFWNGLVGAGSYSNVRANSFIKNGGTLISLTYPLWIMNNGESQTKFRKWLENKNYTMKMLIDNSFVENYKTQPSIKLIIKK